MRVGNLPFFAARFGKTLIHPSRFPLAFSKQTFHFAFSSVKPDPIHSQREHLSEQIGGMNHNRADVQGNDEGISQSQREFLAEQIEQKRQFEEVFNIMVEKKPDQSKVARLYSVYKRRYKNYGIKFKTFLLFNLVILMALIILPTKDFAFQKQFQMKLVCLITDLVELLQSEKYNMISTKMLVNFSFGALSYMERNHIHDLDYLIRVIHKFSLVIYEASEREKKQMQQKPSAIDGDTLRKSDTIQLLLGTMLNLQSVLTELVQLRPNVFLESDFQEVLADYLEIASMHADSLAILRRDFLEETSTRISNTEDYQYYVKNQQNFMHMAGILLTYSKNEKRIVYECVLRFLNSNADFNQFHEYFVINFRMQLYQDIAGKRTTNQISDENDVSKKKGSTPEEIQKLAMELVMMLYRVPECSSMLTQDKLLSNMIKLFTVKNNNMYADKLTEIVKLVADNKQIQLLRQSPQFKNEFVELAKVAASSNKQAKQLLKPLVL